MYLTVYPCPCDPGKGRLAHNSNVRNAKKHTKNESNATLCDSVKESEGVCTVTRISQTVSQSDRQTVRKLRQWRADHWHKKGSEGCSIINGSFGTESQQAESV